MATKPASDWFDIFTEARLPCAPINDVRGGIEFAERLGLEPVVEVGTGEGTIPGVRNPITFSATPASYDLVPPGIDADRGDILEWLQTGPQR
jgi:crotonobetainyl-CoA:carnitine CoA-transferase CaiB-like acyl-CoA transferase